MKKKIIFLIVPIIVILSAVIIIQTRNTYQYASIFNGSDVYIHNKYKELDSSGEMKYFLDISYSLYPKTYNHTLRIGNGSEEMDVALLYDSLFTDIEYAAVEFRIKIPTDVAKEAGILGIDVKGKDTSIDLGKFFDKEDAFIEQWLEVSYLQAEPY